MINRLHLREVLAWTAVLLSLILLSATVAFAQSKTVNVTNENGKVHISVITSKNGVITTKDTTFNAGDDEAIEAIIDQYTESGDKKGKFRKEIRIESKDAGGSNAVHIKDHDKKGNHKEIVVNIPELSEEERQQLHDELQSSMHDMHKGLEEMHKSLKNMHIYINGDEDGYGFNFECVPGLNHKSFLFDDELDSLRDDEHFVIVGDEQEQAPVLEKVITKNGKQVFIYKRTNPKPKHSDDVSAWIEGFQCYPNPNSGKFSVKFKSEKPLDLQLNINDGKGNSVYSEKLPGFEGSFSKEIDLSSKGKGSYMLTISDDENSMTKKIVIE